MTRRFELSALILDLQEEARVLDSESGLGGEGREEIDDRWRELPRCLGVYGERADQLILAQKRQRQDRAISGPHDDFKSAPISCLPANVGDLDRRKGVGEPAYGTFAP